MRRLHRSFENCRGLLYSSVLLAGLLLGSCATASGIGDLALEYFNLGQQFDNQKDAVRAAEFYQKALDIKPDLRMARFNLARIKLQRDDLDAAGILIDSLIVQDPENQSIREMIAYMDAKRGKYEEAWDKYLDILAKTEGRISVLYNLALISKELGREKAALPYLRTLVELRPAESAYLRLAGLISLRAEETADAMAYIDRFREQKKADAPSLISFTDELEKSGFHEQAINFLDTVLQDDEKNGLIWMALAKLQLADGLEASRTSMAKALDNGVTDQGVINEFLALLEPVDRPAFETQIKAKLPDFQMKADLKIDPSTEGTKKPEPAKGSGPRPYFML